MTDEQAAMIDEEIKRKKKVCDWVLDALRRQFREITFTELYNIILQEHTEADQTDINGAVTMLLNLGQIQKTTDADLVRIMKKRVSLPAPYTITKSLEIVEGEGWECYADAVRYAAALGLCKAIHGCVADKNILENVAAELSVITFWDSYSGPRRREAASFLAKELRRRLQPQSQIAPLEAEGP